MASTSSSPSSIVETRDGDSLIGGREDKRVKVDDIYEYQEIEDPVLTRMFKEFNAKYSNGLPCGYRFSPTDIQLVTHYLTNKIVGKPLSSEVIKEINLYEHDADDLPIGEFKLGKKNEAYFFTNLERKYSKGQLPSRTTKNGYWKGTGRETAVFSDKQVVGYKKILVFYSGKAPTGKKTGWVMHEFRVNPSKVPVDYALDDSIMAKVEKCVLCRIQYKKKKESRAERQRAKNAQKSSESSESSDSA